MALIQCPECRKSVSETAETCPNCGFAIKNHVLKQKIADQQKKEEEASRIYAEKRQQLTQEYAQYTFEPPNMTKSYVFIGVCAFFTCLFIICLLLSFGIIQGDGSNPVGLLIFTLVFVIITALCASQSYKTQKPEYAAYKKDPEAYKKAHAKRVALTPEQNKEIEQKLSAEREQLQREFALLESLRKELNPTPTVNVRPEVKSNVQRCPHCNSTKIRHISTANRMVSVAAVGLASGKIGKQFECLNCKYKW